MKKLLLWSSLFLALCGLLGHFYLAKRAYQLRAGLAGTSAICQINEKINCDQALLSPYSTVAGISISSFGFSAHVLIVILLLGLLLKFSLSVYWRNFLFYFAGALAFVSVGMAILSLILSLYCPVCWSLYLTSFVLLFCMFFVLKSNLKSPWKFALQNLKAKNFYFSGLAILVITFFIHAGFINAYNLKDQKQLTTASLIDWQSESEFDFSQHFIMQKGSGDIILVEFADFLCPNCKRVQPALKIFLNTFTNIDFRFYVYPLDATCNSQLSIKGSGLSCELSKALVCAKDKAWDLHNFFFEKQREWISAKGDSKKTEKLFTESLDRTGLNPADFETCMKNPDTLKKVQLSAKIGAKAEVPGTPTFFINGKKVRYSSPKLLIFYKIYEQLNN